MMKYKLSAVSLTALFIYVFLFPLCGTSSALESAETNTPANQPRALEVTDCKKCHPGIVSLLAAHGRAHSTKLTCISCHEGHPPRRRDIIPSCNKCHQGKKHFSLKDCLRCHTNPHTPLKIKLTRDITQPCTTCHTEQIKQLRQFPSIHTTLDCTACHTRHGFVPQCFACHAPHAESMTHQECLECHQAHMPLEVTYGTDVPSLFCGSCHAKVYRLLGKSNAKHKSLLCATCHKKKHKAIPQCTDCHGIPHSKKIIEKASGCRTCHGYAHDLRLNQIDMFLGK